MGCMSRLLLPSYGTVPADTSQHSPPSGCFAISMCNIVMVPILLEYWFAARFRNARVRPCALTASGFQPALGRHSPIQEISLHGDSSNTVASGHDHQAQQ